MPRQSSWQDLIQELSGITQSNELLRAEWHAYEGIEDYGIWLLLPEGPQADDARESFCLFAAAATKRLGIPPIPVPKPRQYFPAWGEYCAMEEEMARRMGNPIDLSDTVPCGLGVIDRDAVDSSTRAWLEWLRRHSTAFQSAEGTQSLGVRVYKTFSGTVPNVVGASIVASKRLARLELGEQREPRKRNQGVGGAMNWRKQIQKRAEQRQAVVMPILETMGWGRGRLVTQSGVGKATLYGYLDGTRSRISRDNRKSIADTLKIPMTQLPN